VATMSPPDTGVKVRMYRHGFGDCFLLAFPTSDPGAAWYLLVDCGLFWSYRAVGGGPTQSQLLDAVAADVVAATGGEIDALVITHEHFDHLAGFRWSAPLERFRQEAAYGELWLAWTERAGDPVADALREEAGLALRMLSRVRGLLPVGELLDFSENTATSLANVRSLFDDDRIRTFDPGEVIAPLGDEGPRFFVLGPPRDRSLLRTNLREEELYARLRAAERDALYAAAAGRDGAPDTGAPFARHHSWSAERAREDRFLAEHYGFDPPAGDAPDPGAWRRIDEEWLEALTDLALQYDDYINNTSLALAVELPTSGKVLLFPGDAQAGNWLSWADEDQGLSFAAAPEVSVPDLLERTVFYKVGHHGSHNATLAAKGLERMTSEELVAFVPTDETWAWQTRESGWRMPYLPLYRALLERTSGRLVQSDSGLPDTKPRMAPHPKHGGLPYSDVDWLSLQAEIADLAAPIAAFREELVETDLYFEIEIADLAD
jgi:hypothetical protein